MATIKKDHTFSSHWRDMMDDYLKVWQVLQWWGSAWYPSHSAPLSCLSQPLLAYLGQCFNTPLTWLYWHTPDSVWWLMSVWVPLFLSPSLCFFLSLLCISLLSSLCFQSSTVKPISHTNPLEHGWSDTHKHTHTQGMKKCTQMRQSTAHIYTVDYHDTV